MKPTADHPGGLLAISDLHVGYAENRALVERMYPESDDDWLLVAGDVAETVAVIRWALETLSGRFRKVSDERILVAQRDLAAREGVFVEPASAAGVAGLLVEHEEGADLRGRTVVVTVTGHGLKDIDTALSTFTDLVDTVVDADVESAARAAGLA